MKTQNYSFMKLEESKNAKLKNSNFMILLKKRVPSEHLHRHARYGLQFALHLLNEVIDLLCRREQHIIDIALRQLSGYGQFVCPLNLLIEVAAHPAEILLILAEEFHRLCQHFYSPYSCRIIELPDCITDHGADVTLIRGRLLLKQCFLLRRDAKSYDDIPFSSHYSMINVSCEHFTPSL